MSNAKKGRAGAAIKDKREKRREGGKGNEVNELITRAMTEIPPPQRRRCGVAYDFTLLRRNIYYLATSKVPVDPRVPTTTILLRSLSRWTYFLPSSSRKSSRFPPALSLIDSHFISVFHITTTWRRPASRLPSRLPPCSNSSLLRPQGVV